MDTGPSPDVVVIGGGIVGVAAAALLAAEGTRVTLCEREALGAGASGRNSGVVQRPFDDALSAIHETTIGLYRELEAADAGFVLGRAPAGLLMVSHELAVVAAIAADLQRRFPSLAPEVLDGPALLDAEPSLAPDLAACRVPIGYPIPPASATYAYATLAERRGVSFRLGRAVRPVVDAGRVSGVAIDGHVEPAETVLVAAGPWTPDTLEGVAAAIPISAAWGVVVEAILAGPPRHVIEEAEMDEALGTGEIAAGAGGPSRPLAGHAAAAPGDASAASRARPDEPGPEFSLVTAGDVSCVGSTFLTREPDPEAWIVPLLERAARFVPSISDAPIRGVRACARPVVPDGRPLVGAVPGIDGLFVCAGHGPWGISTGPGSARLVVDRILGRPTAIPAALDAGRFEAVGPRLPG